MEWPKLKNIILIILLVVNGFLLVLVGSRMEESAQYERKALEQTAQVLENSGIRVELDAAASAAGLVPMTVERDLEREAKLAQALLDEAVQGENRGGGLYLYRGALGEVSFRAGGEMSFQVDGSLSAAFRQNGAWRTDRPEAHAAALLKKLGVEAVRIGVSTQGEETVVRFRQNWNGTAVFSCEVEFVYRDGYFTTLRGALLTAETGTAGTGTALTLPTALMRFSEEIGATGDVCSAIQSMEAGYWAFAQSLSGGARLTPVWLVSTDTADYYLDCVTGALTRLTDR